MSDETLQLKYEILKTRISTLADEHAEALALAQIFKRDFNKAYEKWQDSEKKIKILEERLGQQDVQEEKPRVTIINESMGTSDNKG